MAVRIKFEDHMYISTITCLSRPLKIKIVPGEYTLRKHDFGGHVFAKEAYVPANQHIRKVLNLRDGDPGLSGTYYGGDSNDPVLLDYLNTYFKPYLTDEMFAWLKGYADEDDDDNPYDYEETDSEDSDYEGSIDINHSVHNYDSDCEDLNYLIVENYNYTDDAEPADINDEGYGYRKVDTIKKYSKIREIPCYHNIPIMFYSKKKLPHMNLRFYKWCELEKSNTIVWRIKYGNEGTIGMAVQQPRFYDMMGAQMGLAAYSENEHDATAFANFNLYADKSINVHEDRFYPYYKSKLQYVCEH